MRAVVQAGVAILQQRTSDAQVHAPAGVVVNGGVRPGGPCEELEAQGGVGVERPDLWFALRCWEVVFGVLVGNMAQEGRCFGERKIGRQGCELLQLVEWQVHLLSNYA